MRLNISRSIPVFFSVISLAAVIFYNYFLPDNQPVEFLPEEEYREEVVINYIYEIPSDSFRIEKDKVKRNQTLAGLLGALGVPNEVVNKSVNLAAGIFDVRRFRTGNNFTVLHQSDSVDSPAYFIYEKDPVEYLVFSFADTIAVWNGFKDIDTVRQAFTGKIETSLWNAFISGGANPAAAFELSEIFAWTIDFFWLQREDSFSIVYDEYFVENMPFGIGRIYGAFFRHAGRDFLAIPFEQDGRIDFFDDVGNSLRKAFLKAPLRYSRISSKYSHSRLHPILRIHRPHHGVDYSAPAGTPVVTVGDGVVTKAGYEGAAGNMVRIRHNSTYSTAYLHLSRFGPGIKTGAYVKQGDIIGYVGSTGLSTGSHLDFRFYRNGHPVNPLKVEAPPVEPVMEENRERFELKKKEVIKMFRQVTSDG